MESSLQILSTLGIILGIGHFYFGYVYHIQRTSLLATLAPLTVALCIHGVLYFSVMNAFNPYVATVYFYMAVLFMFVLHHYYDMARLGHLWQAWIGGVLGMWAVYALFMTTTFHTVGALIVWGLVYYHYAFWIFFSARKMPEQRRRVFLKEVAVVHGLALALFGAGFFSGNAYIGALFSFGAFHHLTSVHVLFSYLKERSFFKKRASSTYTAVS